MAQKKTTMEKENIEPKVQVAVVSVPAPVIVDLGSASRKAIKRLKEGRGKLMLEVEQAIEQARARLSDEERNKQMLPVVVIYKKKRRASSSLACSPLNPLNLLR